LATVCYDKDFFGPTKFSDVKVGLLDLIKVDRAYLTLEAAWK